MTQATLAAASLLWGAAALAAQSGKDWQASFPVDQKTLGVTGSNPYFPLTPGYRLSYQHGNDTDVVTVLSATKTIDGVECRVVEDREEENGQLVELTHDYYAIDAATNDVYYMGEDVDVYKNGKAAGHEGAWLSGVNGARFGMMLPGQPKVGRKFYQEQAPGVGMDRVEIKSATETVATPAGTFDNCILVEETTPLEKGVTDRKWYSKGVGAVKDGALLLVSYGQK
ncbi:MAG TPA: hypothetical protein VKF41_06355 [Bryobacteraceae bacterium]|nr:hypothetical protein [Bryobacteraceae bacterium]